MTGKAGSGSMTGKSSSAVSQAGSSVVGFTITVPIGNDQQVDVTHNLNTKDIIVQVFDSSDNEIELEIIRFLNKIKLFFGNTDSEQSYRVVVVA
tara:strand:- start:237 stop:518 length:282 start_codon:yes stop_codon:yes gene_type:complete